jgi:hypothetical protein
VALVKQDPVDAIIITSVGLVVLGAVATATAIWWVVRDYLRGRG